jgi:superfamily II DNA or RNA helicase
MATGTGKTRVFCEVIGLFLAFRPGRRVLVLAHRDELIRQAAARLKREGIFAGIEKGKERSTVGDSVVVGSVQTLRGDRLAAMAPDAFGLIVIDEAHRAASPTYQAIIGHFARAKVLGVTATPDRLDGKPLADTFDSVAYRYPINRAIDEGYLCPIRSERVVVEGLELGEIRRNRGDLSKGQLARLMNEEAHIHAVVGPLLEMAERTDDVLRFPSRRRRPTVVFTVDVAHGRAIADMLNRYRPGCADLVTGKQSPGMRAQIYRNHEAQLFQFLVNCEVLTEGWDAPYVSCVAIARPTMSRALYAQMVGRGTRLCPGKADLLVLDFTANPGRHKLVGPEDVLAGREVESEVKSKARELKLADPALDDLGALALALEWFETESANREHKAKITAVASFYTEQIDPFIGAVIRTGEPGAAHDYQVKALERLGLKPPEALSSDDAAQLLLNLQERRNAGLCSFKMARWLTQNGVKGAHALSKDAARDIQASMFKRFKPRVIKGGKR